jgi:hypothetical protein
MDSMVKLGQIGIIISLGYESKEQENVYRTEGDKSQNPPKKSSDFKIR